MIQKNIGIINYGVGNHSSVINTVKSLGHLVTLSSKIYELDKCEILLLPGVGSFSVAMNGLEKFGLIHFIKKSMIFFSIVIDSFLCITSYCNYYRKCLF